MHIYQKDYLRLLNKSKGSTLARHLFTDKVACIEMQIHLITEDNVETEDFYRARVPFYALCIILTQYYLNTASYIKDLDCFKHIASHQLKCLMAPPTRAEIEDYIEYRKELIRSIECHERQAQQEQGQSWRA